MTFKTWQVFLRQCLSRRIPQTEFQELIPLVAEKAKSSSILQAQQLLDLQSSFCVAGDPLVECYIRVILREKIVPASDLLFALIRRWNASDAVTGTDASTVLTVLDVCSSQKESIGPTEVRLMLTLAARWLLALTRWISQHGSRTSNMDLTEALGLLIVSLLSKEETKLALATSKAKAGRSSGIDPVIARKALGNAITASGPLFSTISVQLFHRLDSLSKDYELSQTQPSEDTIQQAQMKMLEFESGIMDEQVVPDQNALLVYLDAMLYNSATIDDSSLLNFLNTRHSGHHESMFSELIRATFQLFTTWKKRQEKQTSLHRCHCLLVDKVPSLLAIVTASSFGAFSSEACLLKEMEFDVDVELRKRFLNACCRQGLVSSDAVNVFGVMMSTPIYSQHELVDQMKGNSQKSAQLLEELLQFNGNSGAIALALVEVIQTLCQSKETSALKGLSHEIVKKPSTIEIISLYVRPVVLLNPLCTLIDGWRWDELHGESQPVYDEFGSILLLVLAFKHRLNLQISDIGVHRTSPFIAPLLEGQGLTDEKQLGEWINALFVAEGLSDDLTSSCSPQQFYRLVTTLLDQSMLAYECGKLGLETLRAGLEYLLEPFLLPSLVPILLWLTTCKHEKKTVAAVTQILTKEPENLEAKGIHRTIISMTSKEHSFAAVLAAKDSELKIWRAVPQGILACVENMTASSPYSLVAVAVQLHGGQQVLNRLLKNAMTLDVISAIICSSVELRNALRLQYSKLGDALKNRTRAKAIVRLHQRVDLLTAVPVQQVDLQQAMAQPMVQIQPDQHDIDAAIEAAAMGEMDAGDGNVDDVFSGVGQEDDMTMVNFDDLDMDGMF